MLYIKLQPHRGDMLVAIRLSFVMQAPWERYVTCRSYGAKEEI